jgi:hypothetical protein
MTSKINLTDSEYNAEFIKTHSYEVWGPQQTEYINKSIKLLDDFYKDLLKDPKGAHYVKKLWGVPLDKCTKLDKIIPKRKRNKYKNYSAVLNKRNKILNMPLRYK